MYFFWFFLNWLNWLLTVLVSFIKNDVQNHRLFYPHPKYVTLIVNENDTIIPNYKVCYILEGEKKRMLSLNGGYKCFVNVRSLRGITIWFRLMIKHVLFFRSSCIDFSTINLFAVFFSYWKFQRNYGSFSSFDFLQ